MKLQIYILTQILSLSATSTRVSVMPVTNHLGPLDLDSIPGAALLDGNSFLATSAIHLVTMIPAVYSNSKTKEISTQSFIIHSDIIKIEILGFFFFRSTDRP